MTHQKVHRFQIDGEILSDAKIPKARIEYIGILTTRMRSKGYIPLFDIDPAFSTYYDKPKNKWTFLLTLHGVYVGKKRAWLYEAMSSGKLIQRSTPKDKSAVS